MWLNKVPIPEPLDTVVLAYIRYAEGRPGEARRLAEEALTNPMMVQRMRVLALGILLSAPDPAAPDEAAVLLSSVDWPDSLDSVALFPDEGRRVVLQHVGPEASQFSGLTMTGNGKEKLDPRLTKRQLEVLRALDSELTLAEIAQSQYVGLETVRSTAKALYKRLGVTDRDSAVRTAKALNII